jgi:hypothetical protein
MICIAAVLAKSNMSASFYRRAAEGFRLQDSTIGYFEPATAPYGIFCYQRNFLAIFVYWITEVGNADEN